MNARERDRELLLLRIDAQAFLQQLACFFEAALLDQHRRERLARLFVGGVETNRNCEAPFGVAYAALL